MFRSWKNWRAMRLTARGWMVLAVGIVVAPLWYATTHPAPAAVDEPTVVTSYETPCQYQARTARGIPAYSVDYSKGLMAWTRQHMPGGTPDATLRDYWAAVGDCTRTETIGTWDWDAMYTVNVEFIGN